MTMRLTTGMHESPYCCVNCGMTPTNPDGTYKKAVHFEEVDINWGDSVFICWDCGELIADLMGRATRGGFDDLVAKHEKLQAEHDELLEEHERQEALVNKIREGASAKKTLSARS